MRFPKTISPMESMLCATYVFNENMLTYNQQFNKDNQLTVLLGTSWQQTDNRTFTALIRVFLMMISKWFSIHCIRMRSKAIECQSALLSFYMRASFGLIALMTYSFGGDILYLPDVSSLGLSDRGNRNTRILQQKFSAENPDADRSALLLLSDNEAYGAVSSDNQTTITQAGP